MPGTLCPTHIPRPRWIHGAVLLVLFLGACGQVPAATVPLLSSPSTAIALQTVPELAVSTPCGPLWIEGEERTLRGLYRTTGEQGYLDVARPAAGATHCWARFFLDRDLGLGRVQWEEPRYLEVVGRVSSGHWGSLGLWDLQVVRWAELPLDGAAAQSACRGAVVAQTLALQQLEWSALASPAYVTGTAGFRPEAAALAAAAIRLEGADDRLPQVLLSARGPVLPAVRPLVTRWVELECVYDVDRDQVVALTATIRGEVQE